MCIPHNEVSKYLKQKLADLKGDIDNFIVIVRDINTLLSAFERRAGQNSVMTEII